MEIGHRSKQLLEGYVGVKFQAIQCSDRLPSEVEDLYGQFKSICDRLKAHGMTPAYAGNVSTRYGKGLVITASGSNLGSLENMN